MTKKKSFFKWNTTKIIVAGFAALILAGALLLMLPPMSSSGSWTNFADALFTATTSVCVTGLVTVNITNGFSIIGKIVILILTQFGGFGVITVTMVFFMMLKKQISLRERHMIEESYGLEDMRDMPGMIRKIIIGSFTVEGVGAVLLGFRFVPQFGLLRGIWYAVFHSVSTFCNAGLDILGTTSLQAYKLDPLVNFTCIFLIFMGNIGFVVWWDIAENIHNIIKRKIHWRRFFAALPLHTKLALSTSAFVYLFGVIWIMLSEYTNPDTIGSMNFGQKLMASCFEAATLRTAGFETIPQASFRPATVIVNIIMMYIGGSPAGTAGGTKTVTLAVLFFTWISAVKGRKETEVFHRRIPQGAVRAAQAVAFMNLMMVIIFSMLVMAVQNSGFEETLFEVTSAVATTGLSMGLTGSLNLAGKLLIIICMYMGRIGPITLTFALYIKSGTGVRIEYPEGKVMIG